MLAAFMRRTRADKGVSAAQLAKQLGVSRSTVNYWERGDRTPTVANLSRWCSVLGVSQGLQIEAMHMLAEDARVAS